MTLIWSGTNKLGRWPLSVEKVLRC